MRGFKIRGSPGLQFIMADFFFLVVFPAKKKTLVMLPYFNGKKRKEKGQSAIKNSLSSEPITSIQSFFTILVQ